MTALAVCSMLLVAACAREPIEPDRGPWPALVGVRDLRASYRAAVCSRLPADAPPCDEILFRASADVPDGLAAPAADLAGRYRIVFVPGFLNECLEGLVRPFSDVEKALRADGFRVDYLQVSGRGTSAANADQLARQLGALPGDPRPVVVFAYSKGLLDVLELVVRHPEATRPLAAVVAVAGAAYGSPLADTVDAIYRRWFASLPLAGCERGTGEEIEDLQRHVRVGWWRRHGPAITVPVFSIVAAPKPDRVSPVVKAAYLTLSHDRSPERRQPRLGGSDRAGWKPARVRQRGSPVDRRARGPCAAPHGATLPRRRAADRAHRRRRRSGRSGAPDLGDGISSRPPEHSTALKGSHAGSDVLRPVLRGRLHGTRSGVSHGGDAQAPAPRPERLVHASSSARGRVLSTAAGVSQARRAIPSPSSR